ncbi:MAG TPA: UvrD-helicase domain-containing protein [Anaeromyxobacteraceae bacterium]|nr:UvrD-helicase domain-containing protein [Anaeromyxobacteraceae bacterium]
MLDLSTLNPPQREAVTAPEGPLLVLAGAGSGKTRVIAHRVAFLLAGGAPPESILAVTFTNRAAEEMRERVAALAGREGRAVRVSTFHAFGLALLREEHRAAGLPRRFAVADAGDQLALLRSCMREVQVDDRRFDAQRVLALVSRAKNAGRKRIVPRPAGQGDDYDLAAAEILPRYQRALRARRAVDFDDLVALPVALLGGDAALRARWSNRIRHLLVDEYQDTNVAQLELVRLLAGERRDVCAVGDDDQAIYGWRGAEVRNILRFERHFPGARVVRLEQNYRSTGRILACANGVIAKNPRRRPKTLFTEAGEGEKVRVVALPTEEEEARFVASEIARLRGEGRPFSHFAVVYRLNAQSGPVEEALREARMPHVVRGGPAFFDRAEVRDLLAYLKVCATPGDDVSLSRIVNVPARGIGDVSLERLQAWALERGLPLLDALRRAGEAPDLPRGAAERMAALAGLLGRYADRFARGDPAEAARALVAEVDLLAHARATVRSAEAGARKVEAIEGLLRSLEAHGRSGRRATLASFLERLALDSRAEEDPAAGEGVSLLTLHAAKGLEFPVVFLVGLEEDLLPAAAMQGEARDLEEERRLAYVGITRARERLTLTRVEARTRRGKLLPRSPSRFLDDLPPGAHERVDPSALAAPPGEVAAHTAAVMASLRARLGGGLAGADGTG